MSVKRSIFQNAEVSKEPLSNLYIFEKFFMKEKVGDTNWAVMPRRAVARLDELHVSKRRDVAFIVDVVAVETRGAVTACALRRLVGKRSWRTVHRRCTAFGALVSCVGIPHTLLFKVF